MSGVEIIFVGGIHGVGKTTFAQSMRSKHAIPSFSASDLIYKNGSIEKKTKNVSTPGKNQERLIAALERLSFEHDRFILDGHFTLLSDKKISKIPVEYFRQMGLSQLILLVDEPADILQRRTSRDGYDIKLSDIDEHQKSEFDHFKTVAHELRLKNRVIHLSDMEDEVRL